MQKLSIAGITSGLLLVLAIASCQNQPPTMAQAVPVAGTPLDAQTQAKIFSQAHHVYYNVHERGLEAFQCDAFVDWEAFKRGVPTDSTVVEQAVADLKMVKFHVVVDSTGAAKASHESVPTPSDEEVAKRVQSVLAKTEAQMSGVLEMWSRFAIKPAKFLDPAANYTLEEVGNQYRLLLFSAPPSPAQKGKDASMEFLLSRDLTLDRLEIPVTKDKAGMVVDFKFIPSPGGFLLSDVDGDFPTPDGQHWRTTSKYSYQEVGGFQLPRVVIATAYLPDAKLTPFTFVNCQVKSR